MKEGIDRQGNHTFWKNYILKRKKEKGVSMLQAPLESTDIWIDTRIIFLGAAREPK
jgi:hypothetical protein